MRRLRLLMWLGLLLVRKVNRGYEMEDMTKMANKAIPSRHSTGCRCEECLTKDSYTKVAKWYDHNKEAARASVSQVSGLPR